MRESNSRAVGISWGQRIIGIATPEWFKVANYQNEITLHNLRYRLLPGITNEQAYSILMLLTGVFIPLASRLTTVGDLLRRLRFPVSPLRYATLFIGAEVFGTFFFDYFVEQGMLRNTAWEVREVIWSIGLAAFALHGAGSPKDLIPDKAEH